MIANDYHDYVVKDGRMVGAFEEMYRHCADPWLQDAGPSVEEDVAVSLVRGSAYRRILDLGCGKGRFSDRIREATGAAVVALDVAPTAISAGRARYPGVDFVAARVPPIPCCPGAFDLVVTSHLLWYVLPELSSLFAEIRRTLAPTGRYLIVETFYHDGQQRYGNDVMEKPEDLLGLLPFPVAQLVEVNRMTNYQIVALADAV